MTYSEDLNNYLDYIGKDSLDVTIAMSDRTLLNVLLFKLTSGSGSSGGESVSRTIVPELFSATESGSIDAGALYVSVYVLSGTGSVMGYGIGPEHTPFDLDRVPNYTYAEIPYTVNANSELFFIVGREED